MKKLTFRTLLIAALLLAAMTAAALAAANNGLMDWFQNAYNAALPQSAQEALSATEKATLETEKVVFTVNELLCDGKIAYMTAEAQLREEGSAILLCSDSAEPNDRIGEQLAQALNHPQVSAQSTYIDAAKATGLPLYCVSAWTEIEDASLIESEMIDSSPMENGSMLLVRMMYFTKELDAESLPLTIVARVTELNVDTQEFVESSRQQSTVAYDLPIRGVTAERSYAPEESAKLSEHFTLTGVDARQTCAGVYVTIRTAIDTAMTQDEFYGISPEWQVLDAQGNPFPIGISLTAEYLDGDGQPLYLREDASLDALQYLQMISIDALPDSFIITDGTANILVK